MAGVYQHLRFERLPTNHPGVGNLLATKFGYQPLLKDGAWCVALSDRAFNKASDAVVSLCPRIDFRPDNYSMAANALLGTIPDTMRAAFANIEKPDRIELLTSYGEQSRVESFSMHAMFDTDDEFRSLLSQEMFPFLYDRLKQRYVTAIIAHADAQQEYVSFAKIAALVGRLGLENAKEAAERGALEGAEFRGGIEFLDIVDCLTRVFPVPFTLPMRRLTCSWHFHGDGFLQLFNAAHFRGFYQSFLSSVETRASDWNFSMIAGLGRVNGAAIRRLLQFSVLSINRLMAWANDHRTYADENGVVRLDKQIQVFASLRFLFADLLSIHHSAAPHSQLTFAFGFLDKLANFAALIGGRNPSEEPQIFKFLASREMEKQVRRILEPELAAADADLAAAILPLVTNVYESIHAHALAELDATMRTESDVLNRLRMLRNLNHGANLRSDGFADLYMRGKATVPSAIVTLPFVLTMAFVAAPAQFMRVAAGGA